MKRDFNFFFFKDTHTTQTHTHTTQTHTHTTQTHTPLKHTHTHHSNTPHSITHTHADSVGRVLQHEIAIVTEKGVEIIGPLSSETNWDIAHMVR